MPLAAHSIDSACISLHNNAFTYKLLPSQKLADEERERTRREAAELVRLQSDKLRREAERKRLIEEEIHIASVSAFLKTLGQDPASKTREQLLEMTTDSLQREQDEKESKKAEKAESAHFKREQELSFLTRALREKEQDTIASWIDARLEDDGKYATEQQARVVERAEKLHQGTLRVKARLERMMTHLDSFEVSVTAKRAEEHALALVSHLCAATSVCVLRWYFVSLSLESSGVPRSVGTSDH
jgi:hypothetical protein